MKTSGIIYSRTISETVYEFDGEGEEEVVIASVNEEVVEARIASLSEELSNIKTISEFETFDPETKEEIKFDQSSLEGRLNKRFANTSFSADKNEEQSSFFSKSKAGKHSGDSSWSPQTKHSSDNDKSLKGKDKKGSHSRVNLRRKQNKSSFEAELDRRNTKRFGKSPGIKSGGSSSKRNYRENKKGAVKKNSNRNLTLKQHKSDDNQKSTKREKAKKSLSGFSFVFEILSSLLWGNTIVRFVVAFIAGILVFGTIFASQF